MEELEVRLAAEPEARACLALLPQTWTLPVELLIARTGGVMAGAAALYWQSWTTPAGFPADIHVLPQFRRKGIGRALLMAAAELAAPETDGLWSFTPFEARDEAAAFMTACGLTPHRGQRHFIGNAEDLRNDVEPMARHLRARNRLPATARIAPLSDDRLEDIAWLLSRELGGDPRRTLNGLNARLGAGAAMDWSLVAWDDDEPVAVLLCRIDAGVAIIDARAVSGRLRNRWPNILLLEAILLRGRTDGVTRFRFRCDETNRDTLSLARRSAAEETEATALYYYPIASD